jgi:hypothetical protein
MRKVGDLMVFAAVLSTGLACSPGAFTMEIAMFNDGTQPIHMFILGDDFDKSNKIQPGKSRVEVVPEENPGDGYYYSVSGGTNGYVEWFSNTGEVSFGDCRRHAHLFEVFWDGDSADSELTLDVKRKGCED